MKKIKWYTLSMLFVLCSCNTLSGEWYDYTLTNKVQPASSNTGSTPFNTLMRLRYFINDSVSESDSKQIQEDITKTYSDEIVRLHKIFDRHHYYYTDSSNTELITNVKTINDSYGTNNEIKVSEELFGLIKEGIKLTKLTEGYFNILTGGLTDLWDNILSNYEGPDSLVYDPFYDLETADKINSLKNGIPSYEEIDEVLVLDEENLTIKFNAYKDQSEFRPYITVGGIAKGYATQILKDLLNSKGYTDGILYSGGSSITSLGKPIYSKNKGQKINIVDPNNHSSFESKYAYNFSLTEQFNVSTSGNYTQGKSYWFIVEEGKEPIYRHHIINPYSGYPENHYRSVTIISHTLNALVVDAMSTALENVSLEKGKQLISNVLQAYPNSDLDAIYLMQTGSQYEEYKLSVYATSSINNTLKVEDGVTLSYEK